MTHSKDTEKRYAAGTSVIAALFLTSLKLVTGLATGSLGILAEAAHSALDLVAAVVTFLAVRFSDRPPDHEHTYGHGKIENLSALVETLLLIITCVWIISEAIRRIFFRSVEIDPSFWAFLVMGISIVIDVNRSRMLYRVARKYNSQALEADALHFSTDVWSSSVVVFGLIFVWLGQRVFREQAHHLQKADAIAAIGVALIVLFVSYRLGKRTIDVLLDRAPEGLKAMISEAAACVDGVMGIGQVRVRSSGAHIFVDMTLEVDRNLSFERTHDIADAVKAHVQEIAPGADVMIHTDPAEGKGETIAGRIHLIAGRHKAAVHNVSIHVDRGQFWVDLHLEVDEHLTLQRAHELASRIERELQADMPEITRINTHIESRETRVGNGRDVTKYEEALVGQVKTIAEKIAGRSSCHEVVVRRHGDRFSVVLHCTFDRTISVEEVHNLSSRIEEEIRLRIAEVDEVLVHAEPGF